MAEEPDNLMLGLLREIRDARFDHGDRLKQIESRIGEMNESMGTVLGLAEHVNVRHDIVQKRPADLAGRVERLERQH